LKNGLNVKLFKWTQLILSHFYVLSWIQWFIDVCFYLSLFIKFWQKYQSKKNVCKIFLLNKQKEKNSAPYPLYSKYVSFFFLWINFIFLLRSKKIVSIFSYLGNWLKETDNKTNLEDDKRGKKVWVANTKQNKTK
jgi:hypothetical protein